jgi:hypothetical protein
LWLRIDKTVFVLLIVVYTTGHILDHVVYIFKEFLLLFPPFLLGSGFGNGEQPNAVRGGIRLIQVTSRRLILGPARGRRDPNDLASGARTHILINVAESAARRLMDLESEHRHI